MVLARRVTWEMDIMVVMMITTVRVTDILVVMLPLATTRDQLLTDVR